MTRQTPFPGILIDSIKAEAGGGGRTLEFEEGLPEKIPSRRIKSLMDQLPMFGSEFVNSRLIYNLKVAAYTSYTAKSKARGLVRLKNPFEPNFINIKSIEKDERLGILRGGRTVYSVTAVVEK